mmetsp:Transcript_7966/g.15000  ORF Transcript_7966/g.15000 Transcript_7966/m.15000 type:complete len:327 (+) Transcript_7966:201-1181(+)|eukprot:CAMPEP_0176496988 /NCGR_PEP_ID=MMETSP0200_2-20121128/11483_1 /TAXON_ID=947934 /ORGANISM="Chaetoceros sp., Strain GSL56" /LENGTH=326 /DNA_ID=CAMNT_0017894969 /DNA_START=181 /DNA_END=1161 /DNA_ORIENTATION=+
MIYLNNIRDHHQPILRTDQEGHDYVASSESQALLDKVTSKNSLFSSTLVSTPNNNLGIQISPQCPSLDTIETVIDVALFGTNFRSLQVPSPIPIPPFEVICTNNRISPHFLCTSQEDFDSRTQLPSIISLEKRKVNDVTDEFTYKGSRKQHFQTEDLCGKAIKRVKTCRNGLSSQGSLKDIKSAHKKRKHSSRYSHYYYHHQISPLKALSRIGIQQQGALEKFKVPNPLEPETVPAVIHIPHSPPGTTVEDFPDDVSELGLDDHGIVPEEQSSIETPVVEVNNENKVETDCCFRIVVTRNDCLHEYDNILSTYQTIHVPGPVPDIV